MEIHVSQREVFDLFPGRNQKHVLGMREHQVLLSFYTIRCRDD